MWLSTSLVGRLHDRMTNSRACSRARWTCAAARGIGRQRVSLSRFRKRNPIHDQCPNFVSCFGQNFVNKKPCPFSNEDFWNCGAFGILHSASPFNNRSILSGYTSGTILSNQPILTLSRLQRKGWKQASRSFVPTCRAMSDLLRSFSARLLQPILLFSQVLFMIWFDAFRISFPSGMLWLQILVGLSNPAFSIFDFYDPLVVVFICLALQVVQGKSQ